MILDTPLTRLLADSEAVVKAVQIDDSGQMIGQMWMGGNGGLLSHQTLRAVDKLRLTIATIKATTPPLDGLQAIKAEQGESH